MTAPAKFRRITKRSKLTAPCVLAREYMMSLKWHGEMFTDARTLKRELSVGSWTHWLPIQWPEVRG